MDGLKVLESAGCVGENGGNFPRGFVGKLLRGKPAVVENSGRNQMPTLRSEAASNICDLNKVPHPATLAFRQHDAWILVKRGLRFEINNRHAVRGRWRWQAKEAGERRRVEREDDFIGTDRLSILQDNAVSILGNGGYARVESERGGRQARRKRFWKGLDAGGGNPSPAGEKFFQVVEKQSRAGRKVIVEQHTAKKGLGKAAEK